MDKKSTITIVFLLIVGVIIATFITLNVAKESKTPEAVSKVAEDVIPVQEEVKEEQKEPEFVLEVPQKPENAIEFDSFTGSTSFLAIKNFTKSSDEEILGMSENIQGNAWVDFETNSYYLKTTSDIADFKTDDEKQDEEILTLFKNTQITFEISAENDEQLIAEEMFEIEVPAVITINGVTRSELIEVKATLSEEEATCSGEATLTLSDFDIEAPVLKDVYEVEDKIVIYFDVVIGHSVEEASE